MDVASKGHVRRRVASESSPSTSKIVLPLGNVRYGTRNPSVIHNGYLKAQALGEGIESKHTLTHDKPDQQRVAGVSHRIRSTVR